MIWKEKKWGMKRKRKVWIFSYLSKDTNSFEFVNKGGTNFTMKNVVEKITKQPTIIIKALERDFFSNIICSVCHCVNKKRTLSKKQQCNEATTHKETNDDGVVEQQKKNDCQTKKRHVATIFCVYLSAAVEKGKFGATIIYDLGTNYLSYSSCDSKDLWLMILRIFHFGVRFMHGGYSISTLLNLSGPSFYTTFFI